MKMWTRSDGDWGLHFDSILSEHIYHTIKLVSYLLLKYQRRQYTWSELALFSNIALNRRYREPPRTMPCIL